MGALFTRIRKLGPGEYHRKLNHVGNCQTCTGSLVKNLIAQLIYLMLCGIRLIPHGTRLTRVCIFRYTWASSCHGWNSYGTRRPRVCGIPYVSASRVPAGRASRTHEGRVCRPPANWGLMCTAKAPPRYPSAPSFVQPCKLGSGVYRRKALSVLVGPEFRAGVQTRGRCVPRRSAAPTRGARVYAGPANSRQECTGVQHRPYSWGPSLRTPCKLSAGVYPGLGRPRTHRGRHCESVQTRRGCVPGPRPRLHAPGQTLRSRASSGRLRCAPGAAVAGTPRCVTPRWLREPWLGQPTCDHALSKQTRA